MSAGLALVRTAAASELAQYRSLLRWLTRRPDVPAAATPFPYIGAVEVLLWAFIVGSAVELVVLHLVLPWATVRLVVDVLSLWGLLWMLGFMASMKVHPHLLIDEGIHIRNGGSTEVAVPWVAVETVTARTRNREKSRTVQLDRDDQGSVLNVVVAKQTNVDVVLVGPLTLPLAGGEVPVTTVRLYADDPRAFVRQAREHLATSDDARGAQSS